MHKYINFHTHTQDGRKSDNYLSIINISQQEGLFLLPQNTDSTFYSMGLHPWYVTKENFYSDLEKLTQYITHKKVLTIGECGLDALKGEDLDFQSVVFSEHIKLAESHQKPIVIHCVKAYDRLIVLKKKLKPTVPMIVHGFNQNDAILTQLLKNDFYISLGEKIIPHYGFNKKEGNPAQNALLKIPMNRLFLENDDKNTPIELIYEQASIVLGIELSILREQICDNFKRILTHHGFNL